MRKRICILLLACILFSCVLVQNCYAKYVMADSKQMSVYIDKTPPIIELVNGNNKEEFSKTDTNIIKRTEDTTINTSDNIKIERNEIYYNPTNNNLMVQHLQILRMVKK